MFIDLTEMCFSNMIHFWLKNVLSCHSNWGITQFYDEKQITKCILSCVGNKDSENMWTVYFKDADCDCSARVGIVLSFSR